MTETAATAEFELQVTASELDLVLTERSFFPGQSKVRILWGNQ